MQVAPKCIDRGRRCDSVIDVYRELGTLDALRRLVSSAAFLSGPVYPALALPMIWLNDRLVARTALTDLLRGKRVLVLGSGPSAVDLESIPEDVVVLSCKLAPAVLSDKNLRRRVDLYYYPNLRVDTVGRERRQQIASIVKEVSIDLMICEDVLTLLDVLPLRGTYSRLMMDFSANQRVLRHLIAPSKVKDIRGRSYCPWTSTGIRLIQYAVYFGAREIFLIGIDLYKPSWRTLPRAVHDAIGESLGAQVEHAEPAHGGFGPTSVWLLTLSNSQRVVFKGSDVKRFAELRFFAEREERFYTTCAHFVRPYVPSALGRLHVGRWRILLLDDVGRDTILPGDLKAISLVARQLAEMHRATLDVALPDWMGSGQFRWGFDWRRLREERVLNHVAALSGEPAAARRWLRAHIETLQATAERLFALPVRRCLLHRDVRADNLRIRHRRLKLFDWTATEAGPPEVDIVFFAQTVALDGLIDPEDIIRAYRQELRLRNDVLDTVIAGITAHFAYHACQPPVWYLPGLRQHQRRQLKACLTWTARRLEFAHPRWVDSVDHVPVAS